MIFSKICFFRKNLHQILSKFEKRYTWLKSNPWPPDQFFMIFWWFSRNLASFRKFRLIFREIFQICAPVISKSTQQNHLKFLSELSETFFCGTQQTAHELLTQKKSFNFRKKKKNMFHPFFKGFLTHLNNIWDVIKIFDFLWIEKNFAKNVFVCKFLIFVKWEKFCEKEIYLYVMRIFDL